MAKIDVSLTTAGTQGLEATWEQTLPNPNDLDKWELWYGDTEGAAGQIQWLHLVDIIYVAGQVTYTTDVEFTSPKGVTRTWGFRMRAVDKLGNNSGWSNVETVTVDRQGPPKPRKLRITITGHP